MKMRQNLLQWRPRRNLQEPDRIDRWQNICGELLRQTIVQDSSEPLVDFTMPKC